MKKKLIIASTTGILLLALLLWLSSSPSPQVNGSLSATDLAAVESLARKELRHNFFRQLSWGVRYLNLNGVGQAFRELISDHILQVAKETDGTVRVTTGIIKGPLNGRGDIYQMRKTKKDWEVVERAGWVSWFASPAHAPDAAMSSSLHTGRHWRGVSDVHC